MPIGFRSHIEEIKPKTEPKAEPKTEQKTEPKTEPKAEPKTEPKTEPKKRGRPAKPKADEQKDEKKTAHDEPVKKRRKGVDKIKELRPAIKSYSDDLAILVARYNEENGTNYKTEGDPIENAESPKVLAQPQVPAQVLEAMLTQMYGGVGALMDVETRPHPVAVSANAQAIAELTRHMPEMTPVVGATIAVVVTSIACVTPMVQEKISSKKNIADDKPLEPGGDHDQ